MATQKTADPEADLEQHTVAELKQMAAEHDIELPSHATKDEIIGAIESYNAEHPTEPIGFSPMSAGDGGGEGVSIEPMALNIPPLTGTPAPGYKAPLTTAQLAGLANVVPEAVINPQPDVVADPFAVGRRYVLGLAQFANPPAGGKYLLDNMPPGAIVQLVRVKHSEAVAGAGACTAQVSDDVNTYGAALDVTTPPGPTAQVTVQPVAANVGHLDVQTPLYLTLSSATLSAATAGKVSAIVRWTVAALP